MAHLFEPFTQKSMTLRNRVVMSPMCMYSAETDGVPTDFHLVHLGSRALGGCGLIMTEATSVEPVGRLSEGDLGLWNDQQAAAFERIARFCHDKGAKFSIQLAHAGRKAWSDTKAFGPETPVAPSAIAWGEDWNTPIALDQAGIDRIIECFRTAAVRARDIGCDSVEIHAAHGYLLHQFLSPLSNHRDDQYGGSLENRARLLRQVYETVRGVFPADRPIWVRISASDWVEGGWDIDESVELSRMMKQWGVDLVDVSSGGNSPLQKINVVPGYQVPFADRIRNEAGIATGAVGLITSAEQAEEIVSSGKADVVLLARELLRNPQFALQAAHQLGAEIDWPEQYERGRYSRHTHAGPR